MNAVIKANLDTQDLKNSVEELVQQYKCNPSDKLLSAIYYKVEPDIAFAKSIYSKYRRLDDFESCSLYITYDCCITWEKEKNVRFTTYLISAMKNQLKNLYRYMDKNVRKGHLNTQSLYNHVANDDTIELIDLIPDKNNFEFDRIDILSMFEGKERQLVEIILNEKNATFDRKYIYKKLECTDSNFNTIKKHIKQILLTDPYFKKLLKC